MHAAGGNVLNSLSDTALCCPCSFLVFPACPALLKGRASLEKKILIVSHVATSGEEALEISIHPTKNLRSLWM